ncbi:ATP-binding protein [Pseudoalteromonas sp. T1lg48]|uniref:ATP-binding protein n=1 Tax=Pseudoalteromonas sp. T1lg48 TaxID=2077100 RepID=UPI000CF70324|nr:ATP-binding protein [Pseudoalteromonas sp. T1lg48]
MSNPFNKLYVKIFLWFWLTFAATIVLMAALSSVSFSNLSYEPLQGSDAHYFKRLGHAVERSAKKHQHSAAEVINLGRLKKRKLYLYSPEKDLAYSNFNASEEVDLSLLNFRPDMAPQMIFNEHFHALGPLLINLPDGQYQMYELRPGRTLPWFVRLKLLPHWLKITVAIGASLLLSFFFTRTLIGPLNSLRFSARAIAEGQLDSREHLAAKRNDEIGILAREFNAMAQRLETLVNTQRTLLGDISHELRSPLTRLSLACAIAQDKADKDTQVQLQRIGKEAQLLDLMIERILTLSRLENRQQSLQTELMSPAQLLAPVFTDAEFEAKSQHKTLSLPQLPEQPLLRVDAMLLASACENLLRNAIKYANSHIEVSIKHEQQQWQLNIRDDGPGVAEQELAHITEPFYRVGSARARNSGGTGLGLAIAAKAIAAHQGELVLQNHPQGGLVATIKLPTT